MFLHKKKWTGHKFCTFPASDLDLARMTLGQSHDTHLSHKQSLCKGGTSNVSRTDRQDDSYILIIII